MAILNVIYFNHLDLTWRRPRYVAGHTNGYAIKPYMEIQECQFDRAMEFVRQGGCYDIEQTITLRDYLDRNPDLWDEVRAYVAEGRINPLGGGESVLDYNLPDGESLIRNHLYSRRWLKKEFGRTPELAMCPDTFGLSAGLPTLFRELGYKGMLKFHRVFKEHKPYWRGISGDTVLLDSDHTISDAFSMESFIKTRVCGACGGAGCPACGGLGAIPVECPAGEGEYADLERYLTAVKPGEDKTLVLSGEECMVPKDMHARLQAMAERTGYTLRFVGGEQLALEQYGERLDAADDAPEDQIDARPEGNPMATGCFTSRIRIKQRNRVLESLFRSAERLSVLSGEKYPVRTMEYWWRKLAFLQFHDSLPSSHSDDAYDELMETGRGIEAALSRIIDRSAEKLCAALEAEADAFAVLNPLEFDVNNARLTASVNMPRSVKAGSIVTPDGKTTACLSIKHSVVPESDAAVVEFIGDLPALGYGVFRFVPSEENGCEKEIGAGFAMENECLKVTFDAYGIQEVFDKARGFAMACEGTFSPYVIDDAGHLWGNSGPGWYHERADYPVYHESMLPAELYEHRLTYQRIGDVQIARAYVTYSREEKHLHKLEWTAEFRLKDGSDALDVQIRTKFDAQDLKLQTMIALPEAPDDGKLNYEIPLGSIARGEVHSSDPMLGMMDEWAALRYVEARLGGHRVVLANNGTPGHRIDGKTIFVSLMRTPTQLCCAFGIDRAIDRTENTFGFVLKASDSEMDAYRTGMKLNTGYPSTRVQKQGTGSALQGSFARLPDDLPLLALKGAEDGEGYIARYLGISAPTRLRFDKAVDRVDILEENTLESADSFEVEPYKLLTVKTDRII